MQEQKKYYTLNLHNNASSSSQGFFEVCEVYKTHSFKDSSNVKYDFYKRGFICHEKVLHGTFFNTIFLYQTYTPIIAEHVSDKVVRDVITGKLIYQIKHEKDEYGCEIPCNYLAYISKKPIDINSVANQLRIFNDSSIKKYTELLIQTEEKCKDEYNTYIKNKHSLSSNFNYIEQFKKTHNR